MVNEEKKSAINILSKSSDELSKKQVYDLTKSPAAISVKDLADGAKLSVTAWVVFEDNKQDGDAAEILSVLGDDVLTGESVIWATQSATFKREFFTAWEMADGDAITIEKMSGTTKAGRPFVTCAWIE